MNENTLVKRSALKKEIGRIGFFCLAFGAMIGVGWVTAMGPWLVAAGPIGSSLAFAIGGLLIGVIGLCYAEVTAMLPLSGGEVAYSYKAFGVWESFLVGWLLSFGYLSVSAFEAVSIGKITSYLIPNIDRWPLYTVNGDQIYGSHLLIAMFFVSLISYVNYVGIQQSIKFQIYLTIIFLFIVVGVIIAGFVKGEAKNLVPYFVENPSSGIMAGVLTVFATVPFWLVGFDTIPQGAEEASERVSPRMIGVLIVVSIIAAIVFYIFLIISTSMIGNWQALLGEELFTAKAFELAFQSDLVVTAILFAILVGLLTSWNGFFLAGSRVLFALGRGRVIYQSFGKTHTKFGTPYVAVLFSGVITFFASLLGRGAMIAFVDVGSFCIAAAFLGVSLSFLKMKRSFPDLHRPFVTPGGKWMGYVSVVGSVIILLAISWPGSPAALQWPLEWGLLIALSALGIVIWIISKKSRDSISKETRDYLILERYK